MTHAIFISYRRKESLAETRAVYERLRGEFGSDNVFIDLEGLDYGVDFVEVLDEQLENCRVMLALIGPDWMGGNAATGRRLDDENDFVRVELRTALARAIRVVPVLINGAVMPRSDELPDDLRSLVRRHALELDLRRFDGDIGRLVFALRKIMATAEIPRAAPAENPKSTADDSTTKSMLLIDPSTESPTSPLRSSPTSSTPPPSLPGAPATPSRTPTFSPAPTPPLSTSAPNQSSASAQLDATRGDNAGNHLLWFVALGGGITLGIAAALWTPSQTNTQLPSDSPQAATGFEATTARCRGSYEPQKCEELERKLAAETPQERARRQSSLEAQRRASMEKVR